MAHHEITRQPRVKIDLAKAVKLINDKSALVQGDAGTAKSGKGRRKSAFAEEEDGYMFVEEGFRIRFANGEVIDFYADSAKDKDVWMGVLSRAVGQESAAGHAWCDAVLAHEKTNGSQHKPAAIEEARPASADAKQQQTRQQPQPKPRMPAKSAPTSPMKQQQQRQPASPAKQTRPTSPTKQTRPTSPFKQMRPTSPFKHSRPASPTKDSTAKAAGSEQAGAATQVYQRLSARRQQVRSMLF